MYYILLFALLFLGEIQSHPCGPGNACLDVTAHPKFVYCHSTTQQCACYNERGFLGNATPGFPCYCPAELEVYPDGGLSYCTTLNNGVSFQLETAINNIIIEKEKLVYTDLIYPRPPIINSNLINGIYDPYIDMFTEDTKGRISPLGTFAGRALVVEYYAGATVTGATRIVAVEFISVGAHNYTGYVSPILTFNVMNAAQTQAVRVYNLTKIGLDRFNKNLRIFSAEKAILNLQTAVNWVGTLNFSSPALHQQICTVLVLISQCNAALDPLGYYHNVSHCVDFMSKRKSGDLGDTMFDADTVACAYIHMVFTRADPVNHCPHAGRTGGGKCIFSSYITFYSERYRKRVDMEPTAENIKTAMTEILLQDRLNLILAGIPSDSPLVTIPLENFFTEMREPEALVTVDHHHHHHKVDPIAKTRYYIERMKANNYALFDSIYLPQAASLIAAGVPESDPAIAGPRERLAKRKRGGDFYIYDIQSYIDRELGSRDASGSPTLLPSAY